MDNVNNNEQADNNFNQPDDYGVFPIERAVSGQNPELLEFLMENGADINIDLGGGLRPLHLAFDNAIDGMIQNNQEEPFAASMEMIRILLEYGADCNLKDERGKTALI